MTNHFTGVQVVEDADPELVNALYNGERLNISLIPASATQYPLYANSFLVLKGGGRSALCRVNTDGRTISLIRDGADASGVRPKNKEQAMVMNTLLDDSVKVQIISGLAGTGKSFLAIAAAMQKFDERVYDKIILTKPMSQVGKYELGILPGTVEDKFAPFLINYASNVEQLIDTKAVRKAERQKTNGKVDEAQADAHGLSRTMKDFMRFYNVELLPIQLLRGASLKNAFIIADEVQVLDWAEMLTLGTRVAEGSKLVIMGDLNQRDEKIKREKTGLHKTINDPRMLNSGIVSYIELRKVERGPVAELFGKVFEDVES